jgi:hypothetical protein
MFAQEMTETVGLAQCHTCGAESLERDKFCRRCGVDQRLGAAPTVVVGHGGRFEYETRPLPGGANRGGSFSGTLVNFVTPQRFGEDFRLRRKSLDDAAGRRARYGAALGNDRFAGAAGRLCRGEGDRKTELGER